MHNGIIGAGRAGWAMAGQAGRRSLGGTWTAAPGPATLHQPARRPLTTDGGTRPSGGAAGKRLSGNRAVVQHTPVPAKRRDGRIDALRGLALLMIFADHVPPNVVNWYTLHNFSLSDAAEVFVFLAGTSSMLAYGRAFERDGAVAGLRQIAARCAKIYAVQVVLFLLTMAFSWVRRQTGYPTPIAGPLLDAGWVGVLRGVVLDALPTYLDILPLYLVLLAIFPLIYAAARVSPWLALAASGAVWLEVNVWHNMNLPNVLSADGWYFNPFAWQFLFTIGALSTAYLQPARAASRNGWRLRLLCLAYLAFGLLETLDWAHWGLPDLSPMDIGQPDKTLLSPLRLLSILALITLVFSSPGLEKLCSLRIMRPMVACGRHSLEVFATGCLLAYASRSLFDVFGTSWLLQAGVNVVGIGVTFAVAQGLERHRVDRAAVKTSAASGPKRIHTGNLTTPGFGTGG